MIRLRMAVIGSVALVLAVNTSVVVAASCGETWVGPNDNAANPGNGSWSTSSDWSGTVVPGSGTDVCIAGPGVVTADEAMADSISLSGGATLDIGGADGGGGLELTNQANGAGIGPGSAVNLGSGDVDEPSVIDVTEGTLINDGTIVSDPTGLANTNDPSQSNSINATFDNAGTLVLDQSLKADGNWTSSGTIDVSGGTTVQIAGGFSQTAGMIANAGTFDINGPFTASGGAATGNPLNLDAELTEDVNLSGGGTGKFDTVSDRGQLIGDVGPGYTLEIGGVPGYTDGAFTGNDITNFGTIVLGSSDGTTGTLTALGGQVLTNEGTIISAPTGGAGANILAAELVNIGTISVGNSLNYSFGMSTSSGAIDIGRGATLSFAAATPTSTFTQSSGTIYNNGTVDLAPSVGGALSLDGALVNNGYTAVEHPLQGAGAITNNGTFALASDASSQAMSFAQTAGGSFLVGVTGGGSPTVPELKLTGAASLAGELSVATSGTATGTFPLISAASRSGNFSVTKFAGEGYLVGYAPALVELTGPVTTARSAPTITGIRGRAGTITVNASCPTGGPACSEYRATATIIEHLHGNKVTAVTARRTASKTSVVVIASASVPLVAGRSGLLKMTLNATGRGLLKTYGKLKVLVTITSRGKTLRSKTVTITKAI